MTQQHQHATKNVLLLFTAWLLAWVSFLGAVVAVAPILEANYASPLADVNFINVRREAHAVCWDTQVRKVRRMVLLRASFVVDYANGQRDLVRPTLEGGQTLPSMDLVADSRLHTIGPFCIDLPVKDGHVIADMQPGQSTVSGVLVYRSNLFWDIIVELPKFVIPKEPVVLYDGARTKESPLCIQCHEQKK